MTPRALNPRLIEENYSVSNLNTALLCAEASELAYYPEEIICREVLNRGWEKIKFIANEKYDTQLFIAGTKKTIMVCFRGTEVNKTEDWMTNLKFMYEPVEWGKVHSGFFSAHLVVWEEIQSILSDFQNRRQKIFLTGHSLGGALGVMCSMYMLKESIQPEALITFGQPKVGDLTFSNNFDLGMSKRYFRYVNHRDFVTNLPPDDWGYAHCGKPFYFDSRGFLQEKPEIWTDVKNILRRFYYNVPEAITKFRHYHSVNTYISCIKKNQVRELLGSYF